MRRMGLLLVLTAVFFVGLPPSAFAEEGPDCGATAGWFYRVTSNLENTMKVVDRVGVTNNKDYPIMWEFYAEQSGTFTWRTEVAVSVAAKAAIFAEVKAEIRAGIEKSMTTAIGSSVTAKVPANSTVKANYGIMKERVYGYARYRWDNCDLSDKTHTRAAAPYRKMWIFGV